MRPKICPRKCVRNVFSQEANIGKHRETSKTSKTREPAATRALVLAFGQSAIARALALPLHRPSLVPPPMPIAAVPAAILRHLTHHLLRGRPRLLLPHCRSRTRCWRLDLRNAHTRSLACSPAACSTLARVSARSSARSLALPHLPPARPLARLKPTTVLQSWV